MPAAFLLASLSFFPCTLSLITGRRIITLQFTSISGCFLSITLLRKWMPRSSIVWLHFAPFEKGFCIMMQLCGTSEISCCCFCFALLGVAASHLSIQMGSFRGRYVYYGIYRSKKSSLGITVSSWCRQAWS